MLRSNPSRDLPMMRILGVSGSLRAGSTNSRLLLIAREFVAAPHQLEIYPTLGALPYFNPDLDREGGPCPPTVVQFRKDIDAAHAVLLSTPEYAHGIPGLLKNALDWLVSHPGFVDKPIGIILGSTSDGSFAKAALIEVLKTMSTRVVPDAVVSVQGSRVKIAADGTLLDPQTAADLRKAVESLLRFT